MSFVVRQEGATLVVEQNRGAFRTFLGLFLGSGALGAIPLAFASARSNKLAGAAKPGNPFMIVVCSLVGCLIIAALFRHWTREIRTTFDRNAGVVRSAQRMWLASATTFEQPLAALRDVRAEFRGTQRGSDLAIGSCAARRSICNRPRTTLPTYAGGPSARTSCSTRWCTISARCAGSIFCGPLLASCSSTCVRASANARISNGRDSTHCRTGTLRITRSTRCAASLHILLVEQEGHRPRPLHENATRTSCRQTSQWQRTNPRAKSAQDR